MSSHIKNQYSSSSSEVTAGPNAALMPNGHIRRSRDAGGDQRDMLRLGKKQEFNVSHPLNPSYGMIYEVLNVA